MSVPKTDLRPVELKAVSALVTVDSPVAKVNWSKAGDCRGMVAVLKRGLDEGSIIDLDETPFLFIDHQASASGGVWSRYGSGSYPAEGEARCVLRVGAPGEHQSEHHVLGREQVRSRYQSGTRSEKNPAYEVAKVRLRQAEKAAKPGKSSIVKVGDPLIDLVGTLLGSALTGLGQWGSGDQLEEALNTLAATPPSIDHPVYKSYHFERARVRASREAILPIILTDLEVQQSWQVSLKRRELRELFVLNGLDRQDENYANHSQDSLTEGGLQQWLTQAPSLPLVDITAAFLRQPSAVPVDRLALASYGGGLDDTEPLATDQGLDAAALPVSRSFVSRLDGIEHSPTKRAALSRRIKVIGAKLHADGVFIAPHFILTPSEVIGERGLIDVEDGPGHRALGLVAAVDHGLGLALIQAPLKGHPIAVAVDHTGKPEASGLFPVRDPGKSAASSLSGGSIGAPILVDDQLTGFTTKTGPDIEGDAIRLFLSRQQHLLPVER
ncbi:MAG: hypothetical protein AAGA21_13290 [Pseudomonadota bacterium]